MSRDGHADWNRQTAVCARDTCGIATTRGAGAAAETGGAPAVARSGDSVGHAYLYRQSAAQENLSPMRKLGRRIA